MGLKSAVYTWLKHTPMGERFAGLKHSLRSYSQFAEDVYLLRYYGLLNWKRGISVKHGVFVDVGAFRPIVFSNSHHFYKKGWRSINIDPAPEAIKLLDSVRPKATNLRMAVAPERGRQNLYYFGEHSVYNTLDPDTAAKVERERGIPAQVISTETAPLAQIFSDHAVDPRQLEVLSVDAEGYDVAVLQTNDWERFTPRVVLVEAHGFDPMKPDHPVCNLMAQQGYVCHAYIAPNLMFVRSDSTVFD